MAWIYTHNGFDSLSAICYNSGLVTMCLDIHAKDCVGVCGHSGGLAVKKTGRYLWLSGVYVYIGINVKLR
jgi:hypothetical protein